MEEMNDEVIEERLTLNKALQNVMSDVHYRYFEATDDTQKDILVKELMQISDRILKNDENEYLRYKCDRENDVKENMNKLDNEVRLKINANDNKTKLKDIEERSKTEATKMAIQGASSLADIAKVTVLGLGSIALTGAMANMECDGWAPGKSMAFRLASDLGKKCKW